MTARANKSVLGETILEAFDVYTEPELWEIHCTKCDKAWSLPRKEQTHPGNLLFLLNHARSHDVEIVTEPSAAEQEAMGVRP